MTLIASSQCAKSQDSRAVTHTTALLRARRSENQFWLDRELAVIVLWLWALQKADFLGPVSPEIRTPALAGQRVGGNCAVAAGPTKS